MFELPTDLTTTLTVSVVVVSLLWWWWSTHRHAGIPPYPGLALPVVGHLHLMAKDPRDQFRAWRHKYGDIFSLLMGQQLMVVLNGYDVIREALVKQADAFSDRPRPEIVNLMTKAEGVADTSGPVWKVQRKTSLEILRQFGMGKNVLATKVQGEAHEFIKAISSKDSQPFDPSSLVQISVSNNICSIAFGKRFDYDDGDFQKLMGAMEEMFKLTNGASAAAFLPVLRYVPGDPFNTKKIIDLYRSIISTFIKPTIEQHVLEYREDQQDDFINAYLREARLAPGKGLEDYINEFNLQKVIMDVFAAGTDTTATTIRWAIIYFLHYPDVQEKCYQDIVKVTGTGISRPPEVGDRAEMTYVEATIMEVLRIAEIAPLGIVHSTSYDVKLRGFVLPKGTFVMPNLDSVLHDPDVWEDPEKFRPERFLDQDRKLIRPDQFLPFSIGRRVCLGESLARMELFLYLATMIQHFVFKPPPDGQLPSLQGTVGIVHSPQPFRVRALPRV